MKRIFLLVFSLPFFALAQDKTLLIEGTSPNLYLNHTVVAKENFYSIGRLYNVGPKDIAPFNKLQMEKGLNPGQVLKIPLTAGNFSQNKTAASGEVLVPLYYTVKEKDGLYRIGINHNKLPVETLKKWNNIKSDAVNKGTKLVVGYLKVKKDQSALAVKTTPVKNEDKAVIPVVVTPPEKKEEVVVPETKPVVIETPPVKTEEKVIPPPPPVEKVEPQKPVNEPVKEITNLGTNYEGGVFKNLFESQLKGNDPVKEEGGAGVFKSTSGWKDGKYYCLHNTAPAGTIIMITNKANGKSVYAKVLDVIPDIKQNAGLLIRISNAAADELGAGENNFSCILNYSK